MTEYFDCASSHGSGQSNSTEYLDPTGFPIQEKTITELVEAALTEHFELAQGARGTLPEVELCRGRVVRLTTPQSLTDRLKFIMMSSESFSDLSGPEIQFVSDLCLKAHHSEDFYLSDATNQWVRTSIKAPQDLFCSTTDLCKLISSITIQSNVLPSDPFLLKLDQATTRIHFPCSLLKEALDQRKPLMQMVLEWKEGREECELSQVIHGSRCSVDLKPSRLFWEIRDDDDAVQDVKLFAEGSSGTIWLVTWRGGMFVRKDRVRNNNNHADPRDVRDTELDVTEKLSHPHIVYSFGVSFATHKSSLYMEYMESDLFALILDRASRTNASPFSHQDSLDILLQIAEAMEHMHGENVVHGDLKSLNILVSKFMLHYLVKVADLGSAQTVTESTTFQPGDSTTNYAAPEVLKRRADKTVVIDSPKVIDVYSFGIIAFEVLTGEELYHDIRSRTKLVQGIIDGTLRPPLREECQKDNFLHDESLFSLIESCWDGNPSKRPPFSEVVDVLNSVKARLLNPPLQGDKRQREGKCVDATASCEEPSSSGSGLHSCQKKKSSRQRFTLFNLWEGDSTTKV